MLFSDRHGDWPIEIFQAATPLPSPGVRRSLFDFKSNLAVVPRCDRVEDCANRLSSTALLANYSAQVFLRHAQLERFLDLQKILSDLTAEKDRINRAIDALLELPSKRGPKKGVKLPRVTGRRRRGMTPEGRRRLSEAMKKRWAERKRKKS